MRLRNPIAKRSPELRRGLISPITSAHENFRRVARDVALVRRARLASSPESHSPTARISPVWKTKGDGRPHSLASHETDSYPGAGTSATRTDSDGRVAKLR